MRQIVVMGVSGCGKSLIGAALAEAAGLQFIDGDALHPPENIEKMRRAEPLTDEDRAPWLDRVGAELAKGDKVIACSALRRTYRDRIRSVAPEVKFLYLHGTPEVLLQRVTGRDGHFMPPALLSSQLATLDVPTEDEPHFVAQITEHPEKVVASFLSLNPWANRKEDPVYSGVE